ncbi:MAG: hypothetical protein JWN52_2494 [Actinomycetia bacterium]|nr:hypothetical protein [Actinomycetes bacterium]
MVALTDPVEGEDDEYNAWYSDTHLGEVLAIDGCVAAQRFRVVDGTSPGAPHRYLAIYEIEDGNSNRPRLASRPRTWAAR